MFPLYQGCRNDSKVEACAFRVILKMHPEKETILAEKGSFTYKFVKGWKECALVFSLLQLIFLR